MVCREGSFYAPRGLLLIRLLQETPICSVRACRVRHSRPASSSFRGSSPTRRPAGSTWRRVAGRTAFTVRAAATAGLPGVVDSGHRVPPDKDPADGVVLGRIFDDDRQAGDLHVHHRATKNYQLDLFDPNDGHYEYSAVTSNLDFTLANLWRFACGRGNHEKTIAQLKTGWPSTRCRRWLTPPTAPGSTWSCSCTTCEWLMACPRS